MFFEVFDIFKFTWEFHCKFKNSRFLIFMLKISIKLNLLFLYVINTTSSKMAKGRDMKNQPPPVFKVHLERVNKKRSPKSEAPKAVAGSAVAGPVVAGKAAAVKAEEKFDRHVKRQAKLATKNSNVEVRENSERNADASSHIVSYCGHEFTICMNDVVKSAKDGPYYRVFQRRVGAINIYGVQCRGKMGAFFWATYVGPAPHE